MSFNRSSGVLMPIFSLPGEYGIGGFGKEAYAFVDFLAARGFSYWQVLPFGVTDSFHSPYQSYSAFSGNPYFVDLPTLADQGLLTPQELLSARQSTPYVCEYDRLAQERLKLLKIASQRVSLADRGKVDRWAEEGEMADFARFMALKQKNGGKCWIDWTETEPDSEEEFLWRFIEFHFFDQWQKLLQYAHQKGIHVIGDLPIYVSFDSCDVWCHREQFLLDETGHPLAVAGCPPDYFSADGQLWGNPLYNWQFMGKDGFSWWKKRIRQQFSMFDGIRLDHFRGFESYWSVPADAPTAAYGSWQKGPGTAFVDMLKAEAGEKLIIAEDLGEITPAVEELVAYSGFPGMRVFQFAFLGGNNPHLPHNYIPNCVAYSGTHDNNTLLGYLWEQDDATRARMLCYCGFSGADWGDGCKDIIRALFASSAGLLILPIQDLLGYGSDTRINRPGVAEGNWQYRVTADQLNGISCDYWKSLNQLYMR